MQEEEDAFRKQMLAKFAEDDRIEQMNAQKRRMKQLEHRRAVEKLIEDRRKQFIADKVRVFTFAFGLSKSISTGEYGCSPKWRDYRYQGKVTGELQRNVQGEAGPCFGVRTKVFLEVTSL